MIEDGALEGRKLLIIPNTGVTITSARAIGALKKWVRNGGTLLCFGDGCLAYTFGRDGFLRADPTAGGLRKPGRRETAVGLGKTVWIPEPIRPHDAETAGAALTAMVGLRDELGLTPAAQVVGTEEINLIDCGPDAFSGKRIFALDCMTQMFCGERGAFFSYDKSYTLRFGAPLDGEAEILGLNDAEIRCEGAEVRHDRESMIFVIEAKMPCEVKVTFGKPA